VAQLALLVQIALAVVTVTPQQKAATVVLTTDRPGVFSGAAGITFAETAVKTESRPNRRRLVNEPLHERGGFDRGRRSSFPGAGIHGRERRRRSLTSICLPGPPRHPDRTKGALRPAPSDTCATQ
jgi:hypothetical protein